MKAIRFKDSLRNISKIDWLLVAFCCVPLISGVLLAAQSSAYSEQLIGEPNYFFFRHLTWIFLAFISLLIFSLLNLQFIRRFSAIGFLMAVLLSIVALVLNNEAFSANRTLLSGSLDTGLLLQLTTIVYIIAWICDQWQVIETDPFFIILRVAFLLGISGGLIILAPDFGQFVTLILIVMSLLVVVGVNWKIWITLAISSLLVFVLFIQLYPSGMERIQETWAAIINSPEISLHLKSSFLSVNEGGLLGSARSDPYLTLPFALTDSSFSLLVNQFGLLGGIVLIVSYVFIILESYKISKHAQDPFSSLLAIGIGLKIAIEVSLHILVLLGLIPFVGLPLPLVSYGGSHLMVTFIEIGILINISRPSPLFVQEVHRHEKRHEKAVSEHKIVAFLRKLLP